MFQCFEWQLRNILRSLLFGVGVLDCPCLLISVEEQLPVESSLPCKQLLLVSNIMSSFGGALVI